MHTNGWHILVNEQHDYNVVKYAQFLRIQFWSNLDLFPETDT